MEKYYKAYDKRYKQLHDNNLAWEFDVNSVIISDVLDKYKINKSSLILEIGCGEGRDARYLLDNGYNILASDVSLEAINYCKKIDSIHFDNYCVIDVLDCNIGDKFDFIYSIACLHMLVLDSDRKKFFDFIFEHLNDDGFALILTMGDGVKESSSDISKAFDDVSRVYQQTGDVINVAATSCRVVNFDTLFRELDVSKLIVVESGITSIIPNFPEIMYVVVEKGDGYEN